MCERCREPGLITENRLLRQALDDMGVTPAEATAGALRSIAGSQELEAVTLERDLAIQGILRLEEQIHELRSRFVTEPKTPDEIAAALRHLSKRMLTVGTAMQYYGGYDAMAEHGRKLNRAAMIAAAWANWSEG